MLAAKQVEQLAMECMCETEECDGVVVEGIVTRLRFDVHKLEANRAAILELLLELPLEFRRSSGGGWSFLNACNDKHGRHWTGDHSVMERLFQLGMGIGLVELVMPRALWVMLPGEMPYYVIND